VSASAPRRPDSAGLLLYRGDGPSLDGLEVLLVHPSGNYNRKAPWGIPKGLPDPGEEIEAAARRETLEETGVEVTGPVVDLGEVRYTKSRKRVQAFAAPAPADAAPRCASWEVDCAEFVSLAKARAVIHPDQAAFLDRLVALLERPDPGAPSAT
jgi:predicted NUDIX family NTP pyrophosphohydrolase